MCQCVIYSMAPYGTVWHRMAPYGTVASDLSGQDVCKHHLASQLHVCGRNVSVRVCESVRARAAAA